MTGIYGEWCWDWYSKTLKSEDNPLGNIAGTERCIRGGSWVFFNWLVAHVYWRNKLPPCNSSGPHSPKSGLRVVRSCKK